MKKIIYLLVVLLACCMFRPAIILAQVSIIEIDSLTRSAVQTAPFDKPFLIKVPVDADYVKRVFLIKRHKHGTLDETVKHNIDTARKNSNGRRPYQPLELEPRFYEVRKLGDKNFLFITIAEYHLFKPSESYFILLDLRKTDPSAITFFDAYYQSTVTSGAAQIAAQAQAVNALSSFEIQRRRIFGDYLTFGFMTLQDFTNRSAAFAADRNVLMVNSLQGTYETSKQTFINGLPGRETTLNRQFPSFDSITKVQLLTNAAINKDAADYLSGNNIVKNDFINDLNFLNNTGSLQLLLSGAVNIGCPQCEAVNIRSNATRSFSRRIDNIDSTIRVISRLQRSLYLLKGKANNIPVLNTEIIKLNSWLTELQTSRADISNMLSQRKQIESVIMDSVFDGSQFTNTEIVSGNSYMNFETRNKVLLTPDFGIVTSAFTSEGRALEYGIVPYIGFHINLMAVDKDITFKSYKKHPLQYYSIMVGWSLVNMNQDNKYANFFEKSSLLTGIGYRLSNTIRLTAGTQWLFKIKTTTELFTSRKLQAIPFVGLSFDLNVRQYLNGFFDILSGIGKSKPVISTTTSNQ